MTVLEDAANDAQEMKNHYLFVYICKETTKVIIIVMYSSIFKKDFFLNGRHFGESI